MARAQADRKAGDVPGPIDSIQDLQDTGRMMFKMADMNNDNQISQQEAESARRMMSSQVRMLRVPEPANSASNLIESGQRPGEAAPAPNFGAPGQGQPRAPQRNQPAPGGANPQ